MIGTTGVALDFIYQGIAKNRISLAPLSATQALLQDGKIPIPFRGVFLQTMYRLDLRYYSYLKG
jgi:hypothetical protein